MDDQCESTRIKIDETKAVETANKPKAGDSIDAMAAMFVGSMAKNVMEGGAKMFQQLLQVDI